MGYPGKNRKTYDTPKHPWQSARFASEVELIKMYGLRNKREVWKAYSELKNYRVLARKLLAESTKGNVEDSVKVDADNIMNRLKRFGLLKSDAVLDDVLALDVTHFLDRRLQTQVHKQGLANTMKQARQFIVHGHISVGGLKVTVPSYLISMEDELRLDYYGNSPMSDDAHPSRPAQVQEAVIQKTEVKTQAKSQAVPQTVAPKTAPKTAKTAKTSPRGKPRRRR